MVENVLNKKEIDSLDKLEQRYIKLTTPNQLAKLGEKGLKLVPKELKKMVADVGNSLSEQEIYSQTMELLSDGFKVVTEQAAKFSVNEKDIIKDLNKLSDLKKYCDIPKLRSYDIAKAVNNYKTKDLLLAFAEGAGTGVAGFAGLPFNLVLSNLLYFRAVQTVAMYYGYDVKNDSGELALASTVFTNALSPTHTVTKNELSATIAKVMMVSKSAIVGQAAQKGWVDMAGRGGVALLLTQIRALSNRAAQKALEKAGQKGLENTLFKEFFELLGKKLTQNTIQKSIPFVSAGLSALIDTAQMNQVLEYADVFYQKRFILEKEERIRQLHQDDKEKIIDVTFTEK